MYNLEYDFSLQTKRNNRENGFKTLETVQQLGSGLNNLRTA